MKVRASVGKMCDKCRVIKRSMIKKIGKGRGRRFVKMIVTRVICQNPRHKQRQG